jgi:hypothetical protein
MSVKDYLGYENARNKTHAHLYNAILQKAFNLSNNVMIGHHLCFEFNGDIDTENEIPSADTLIFDHSIMGAVFGDRAVEIMCSLASFPAEKRDERLAAYFEEVVNPSLPTSKLEGDVRVYDWSKVSDEDRALVNRA